jgi:hypothetical protein
VYTEAIESERTSRARLQDDEDGVARSELAHFSVHARNDVRHCLSDGDEDA